MARHTRRTFLRGIGTATVTGLAGCSGGGESGTTTAPENAMSGDEYPAIDEWLTESEVGAAAGNYEGYLLDKRDSKTVTVAVGAEGNTGSFAFDPTAIVVSKGITITWQWTGKGDPHSVDAAPDEQLGKSDYTFTSGQAERGADVTYTQTLDKSGIALYHCDPHLALGMKGGIAVE